MNQNIGKVEQPSAEYLAMTQFCSANINAIKLLNIAARDYADARCLLLNHLVSGGLTMGAQAIEKFLKADILLEDPTKTVWGHGLTDLLSEADRLSPGWGLSRFAPFTDRFERHYRARYPDDPNTSVGRCIGVPFGVTKKHRSGLRAPLNSPSS